jgi:hypothetical protein
MAKVNNNLVTYGLSGLLGNQLVFRKGKAGNTIVAVRPAYAQNRTASPSQEAHQEAFREAIAYAKSAKDETVYITKAQGTTMSAFNAAVADWFNAPKVLEIDVEGWTGAVGQTIRVKAQDDTQVAKVHVVINHVNSALIEEGDAVQAEGLWWTYTTTGSAVPQNSTIVATAQDLPGNSAEKAWLN